MRPDQFRAMVRASWDQGFDALIVAGGDGTVHTGAGIAIEMDLLLGVLPLGTLNHFAKDIGMPGGDLASAVEWLRTAVETPVDVGDANGTVFVNNASIGAYPAMVIYRDEICRRRGWGKVRATPAAIARTLRRLHVFDVTVKVDDAAPEPLTTAFLFVGNGVFDRHGNHVGRRTSLTDHRLGLYVIATSTRRRLVANAIAARLRGVTAAHETERYRAESLEVAAHEPSLLIALDGEPTNLSTPITFHSRPSALRILVSPTRSDLS